jgi:hypothetical protein
MPHFILVGILKQREIGSKQWVTVAVNDPPKNKDRSEWRILVKSNIYRRREDSDIARLPVNIPVYRADGYGMTTGSTSPHRTRTRHTRDPHTRGVVHTRAIP